MSVSACQESRKGEKQYADTTGLEITHTYGTFFFVFLKNITVNIIPWTCYQGVLIPRDFDIVTLSNTNMAFG